MKIYQATNGKWLIFNNNIKSNYIDTENEAMIMASKITFTEKAQTDANSMASLADNLSDLYSVYFDRGYNVGGSNPITDADLVSLGITANQLADMMTLAQQFTNFLGNVAVTQGDYDATLNAIRTDI